MKGLTRLAEGPAQVENHKFGDVSFYLTMSVSLMSLVFFFFTIHKAEGGTYLYITIFISFSVYFILGNKFQDSQLLYAYL